ncbi:MAG: dihydrofolate reductase family protein, partial [Bacteroidia bacterium]|nr:dihydrofolate reductase family protein [Bacteroidia bacterium]
MTKIKLFIASTLDGYIAGKDGNLDWLNNYPDPKDSDYGYGEFYAGIDIVIMGRKTYEEVLGFGVEWPYGQCKSYIVTSQSDYRCKTVNTEVLGQIDHRSIDDLKSESRKHIWLIGGGQLNSAFPRPGQIDELLICFIPVILG